MRQNRLSGELRLDPLRKLTALLQTRLPSCIWREESVTGVGYKKREGKEKGWKGEGMERGWGKRKRDRRLYQHFFFPSSNPE